MSAASPSTKATVTTSNAEKLAAATEPRSKISLYNTSSTATEIIYIAFGVASAANEGIVLAAGAGIVIDRNERNEQTLQAAVNAISASGSPVLAIHEFF